MTPKEYVESGISLESDNSQTWPSPGGTTTPFEACNQELLGDGGSATSTTTFAVVGLTEGFDESLILLRRTFGWSKLHYPPANFSLRRGGRPVPRSVLERIEALNWLDADLYEYAQRRMQQAIDAAAQFDADLRRFRRSNSLYRRTWGAVTYTLGPRPY